MEMEALTAVSIAALTIYDMCKAVDKSMTISKINLLEKVGGKSDHATEYRPQVGVITISDSVSSGKSKDKSGPLLITGFSDSGCSVEHKKVLPDGSDELMPTIQNWIKAGVELIITTGGTGLGPRDLTIKTLEDIFDSKLPGVEQALHAYGRGKSENCHAVPVNGRGSRRDNCHLSTGEYGCGQRCAKRVDSDHFSFIPYDER